MGMVEENKVLNMSFTHLRMDSHKMKVQFNPHCIPYSNQVTRTLDIDLTTGLTIELKRNAAFFKSIDALLDTSNI